MTSIRMRGVALLLRALNRPASVTLESARERLEEQRPQSVPPDALRRRHRVVERDILGFTCFSVTPHAAGPGAGGRAAATGTAATGTAVLYLHGGAYVSGIAPQQWSYVSRLVDAGIRVDVADYGLAPKYTYRDAYPFLTETYRALVGEVGADATTIVGDSAGCGLAVGLAQTLRAQGLPQPARMLLVSPWLDLTLSNPEIAAVQPSDPWLSAIRLREAGRAWAAGDDETDPRLSPINGPLGDLPPSHIYIGTRDILYPDTLEFARKATAAGAEVTVDVCVGAVHVYPILPAPEGRRAMHDILRRLLG